MASSTLWLHEMKNWQLFTSTNSSRHVKNFFSASPTIRKKLEAIKFLVKSLVLSFSLPLKTDSSRVRPKDRPDLATICCRDVPSERGKGKMREVGRKSGLYSLKSLS